MHSRIYSQISLCLLYILQLLTQLKGKGVGQTFFVWSETIFALKIWNQFIIRDLPNQFWCPVDGTKKLNLLIEFSKSIFIKFDFKTHKNRLTWKLQQKKSACYSSRPMSAVYNKFAILFHDMEHSKTQSLFNPNKAGLLKVRFSGKRGGWSIWIPLHISRRTYLISI